jgi:hypothetical protein
MTTAELVNVEVVADSPSISEEFDYNLIADPHDRDWAESAAGFITFGLGQAVVEVLKAGSLLIEAKQRLAHGEYLPWVERACGLKRNHASQLVKAAEWANVQHVEHLHQITDTATLFLLSADATPEDVRQWALERCAAGQPPSRKEVAERKRQAQGKPSRTLVQEVLSALKLSPEARDLAAKAEHISTRQLLQELNLDELPKGREHSTFTHLYCKNGTGWWKLPQKPVVQVQAQQELIVVPNSPAEEQHITVADAANLMGFRRAAQLGNRLTPSNIKRLGFPKGNGYQARPSAVKCMCFVRPWP